MTSPLRVLVVEDNAADVDLVREALSEAVPAAFHIESAPRLSSALAHLEARGCDLILLDLGLPDSQGLETLRKLRQTVPGVPVIVLTGTDDEKIGVAAVASGAQDYLVKGEVNAHAIARSARHAVERAQAARRLQESEEMFRTLYENATIGLYRTAPDGTILLANPALVRMLGFSSPDELLVRNLAVDGFEPSHPRSQFLQHVEKEGTVSGFEAAWRRRDGTALIVRESARAIRDSDGKTVFYDGTVEDITERKQAEDALRREKRTLARAESIANVGSWQWDIATDTVTWSDELFRIFQREPREGAPSFAEHPALYPPDDMARLRRAVEVAVAEGTPYELELRAIRRDGEVRLCVARGFSEIAQGGRVVRLFGSIQDITERKLAEEARQESEERFRSYVENAGDIVYTLSPKGIFTYVSPSWESWLGHDVRDVVGRSFADFVHPDHVPACRSFLEKALATGASAGRIDYRVRHNDGSWRWHSSSGSSLVDDGDTLMSYIGIARDITVSKQIEEELELTVARLREAQRTARLGSWETNVATHEVTWSDELCRLFEIPPEVIRQGRDRVQAVLLERIHPDDRATYEEAILQSERHRMRYDIEYRVRLPDGSQRWLLAQGGSTLDGAGNLVRLSGTVMDITERKQAEQSIRSQLEELQRWEAVMLDRETRVQETKREVNELLRRLGEPIRYPSQEDAEDWAREA